MADESVCGTFEQLDRRADLHHFAQLHHHHLIGKGQRLGLVVGDVDHRRLDALVQFLELGAQLPFQMRVDHGERLVEHHHIDVLAHETTPHRDLLLVVGAKAGGLLAQHLGDLQHLGDRRDALFDGGLIPAAIAQWEGEVVVDCHGVVDHRKLEHLRDIALVGGQFGDVLAIKQDLALRRHQQAGDDVQEGGLATTGGAEQRISTTVVPVEVDLLQRVVAVGFGVGQVAVPQFGQGNLGHLIASRHAGAVGGKDISRPGIHIEIMQFADLVGVHAMAERHPGGLLPGGGKVEMRRAF